jgi:hypothetical protein
MSGAVSGLALVLVALFVYVSARTFVRSWKYREALKDERFEAVGYERIHMTGTTGDLIFFTASAHPFHNSWVNRTLFTHVGVLVRGADLIRAGVSEDPVLKTAIGGTTLYVAECAEGIPLADVGGGSSRLPGGSYLVPLAPRLHGYNGLLYWGRRTGALSEEKRGALAKTAASMAGSPYPGRWAMIFAAVVGLEPRTPNRQCYQHSAALLNSIDADRWRTGFFASAEDMDAAAMGETPLYTRCEILQRLI